MLLSIEELRNRIKNSNVDLSNSYTHNKKLLDFETKTTIDSLFHETGLHRQTIVHLLINDIDPANHQFKCEYCGSHLKRIKNNPKIQFTRYCSRRCSQIHRRIIDPEYQARMVEKAMIKRSIIDPATGLTPAQVGSLKTAQKKRENGTIAEITRKSMESNRKTFQKKD